MTQIYRAWIDQPSTLQPLHRLHGTRAIAVDDGDDVCVTLHFTEGSVHSMRAPRLSIRRIRISAAG